VKITSYLDPNLCNFLVDIAANYVLLFSLVDASILVVVAAYIGFSPSSYFILF